MPGFSRDTQIAMIAEVIAELKLGKTSKDAIQTVALRPRENGGRTPGAGTLQQWVMWHPDYVALMAERKKAKT